MSDEDLAAEALTMDPSRSQIVMLFGTKGRGKSAAARTLFDAWPYDRGVIDPTGDARPDDPHAMPMIAPFLSQLPDPDYEADPPQHRVTLWARLDPKSRTFEDDQDQAMSMMLNPRHRRKLVWRDEFGMGISAGKILPNDKVMFMSSRHYNASALFCCPRPVWIPKMPKAQADKFLIFHTPVPEDREDIAKHAGVSVPTFERAYNDMKRRDRFAFLLFDRELDVLLNCPPLPNVTARGPKA